MSTMSKINLHLEPDLLEALTEIAHETHITKANFIRQSLRRNIDLAKPKPDVLKHDDTNMIKLRAQRHRGVLIAYLRSKTDIGDWHGVSDAANDLRELEAAHP